MGEGLESMWERKVKVSTCPKPSTTLNVPVGHLLNW